MIFLAKLTHKMLAEGDAALIHVVFGLWRRGLECTVHEPPELSLVLFEQAVAIVLGVSLEVDEAK